MKKIATLAIVATLSTSVFAETTVSTSTSYAKKLTTSELKSMDCATLSVEKSDAKRSLATAEQNITAASTQTQGKSISKWAGMASGALSAFGGNSDKAAKANQVANSLAGQQDTSDASNVQLQQQIKATSQANIDNIGIYQGSKKCKI